MFDIPFHINLFISLIELEYPLKVSNKGTNIALPIYFFNWGRASVGGVEWGSARVNLGWMECSTLERLECTFCRGAWVLGYRSMGFGHFPNIP